MKGHRSIDVDLDATVRALLQVAPGDLDALGFYATRQLPDGRWLALEPMTFGRVRIGITKRVRTPIDTADEAFQWGYEDVFEFLTKDAGLEQLRTWDGVGEPTGWSRHPRTQRRRQPDGSVHVRDHELPRELIAQLRAEIASGAGHECEEWWGVPHGAYANRCVLCDRQRGEKS